MMSRRLLVLVVSITGLSAFAAGCATDPGPTNEQHRIACTDTPDCAGRGGTCSAGECHADNECVTGADCADPTYTCVPDADFVGLCTPPGGVPAPGPAWACTTGKDCPAAQGCGSDGLCHIDGECTDSSTCGLAEICYNGRPEDPAGFCAADRPANDPYCRSDGLGACRQLCHTDGTCDGAATCVAGYCHSADECLTTADCTPNHLCQPWADFEDYGYSLCVEDPDPTCVDDGAAMGVAAACRLACAGDGDCLHGGGCEADGLCHASNECATDADCADPALICYPDPEFGGLCGPPRP